MFHAWAILATTGSSLGCSASVTSTRRSSAITCDGIIVVAVNSWEKSANWRFGLNVTRAFFARARNRPK